MKKICILAIMALAVASFGAAFDWNSAQQTYKSLQDNYRNTNGNPDQAVVAAAQKFVEAVEPKDSSEKRFVIVLKSLVRLQTTGADQSFAAHKAFIDEQLAAAGIKDKISTESYLNCYYFWWFEGWVQEVYDFMITVPDYRNWINSGHVCERLGKMQEAYDLYLISSFPDRAARIAIKYLNDPVKAFAAVKMIIVKNHKADTVNSCLNIVTQNLIGNAAITDTEMKQFLQTINRKYSGLLSTDEAKWTPVVKRIRTMLETY